MRSRAFILDRRNSWLRNADYLAYLVLVTGVLFARYANWAYDDPYIAYRYVHNLISGAGFVYNPGERILSTTTPLYVLVLAALTPLPVDLPHLSNLVGAFCLACGGLLLWDLARSWDAPVAGWVSLILYPGFPLLTATLGSEMPLYLALCLGSLAGYARQQYSLAAGFAALATLTRPDGLILAMLLAAHYWATNRKPLPWRSMAWFALITLPWVLFAWAYFGSPIPVTLAAKQHQGSMVISQRFAAGLITTIGPYLRWPFFWLQLILVGIGLVYSFWAARRWILLWAWAGLYFAGYALLGVSRYFWYYAPLAPGFIAAIGVGVMALHRGAGVLGRSASRAGYLLLGLAVVFLFLSQSQLMWRQASAGDLRYPVFRLVGEWLAANTPPDASVGMLEIGVIGYYADRPVVDFAGLVQPEVGLQLRDSASYEGAALWAMRRYRPDYLVLREKLFPSLEADYVARYCRQVQQFPASDSYPWSIAIYSCHSGN
jgi:hypothetical protein